MIDLNFCLICLRYSFASAFIPFMLALAWRFAFAVAKDFYRKRREAAENAEADAFVRYVRYVEYGDEREEQTEGVQEVEKAENGCGCCLFPFVFFALFVFLAPRLEPAFKGPCLTDYGFWDGAVVYLALLLGYLGGYAFAQKFAARRSPTLDTKRRECLVFWLHPLFSFPLAIALSFPFVLGCAVDRAHALRKAGATVEDVSRQGTEPPTVPALETQNADDR